MGIVVKNTIWSTLWAYLGLALGAITTLYLFPYILSTEQLGLVRVMLSAATILSQFALLGTQSVIINFSAHVSHNQKIKTRFFYYCTLIASLGSIAVSIIYIVFQGVFTSWFAKNSALFNDYYYHILPYMLGIVLYCIYEAYCRSQFVIIATNFTREVLVRILTILFLTLYFFKIISFHVLAVSLCYTYAMAFIALIFLNNKKLEKWDGSWNTNEIIAKKDLLHYGFYSFLTGSGWTLVSNIDVMLISALSGLTNAGIYSIAIFMSSVIQMPQRMLVQTLLPLLSIHWKNKDLPAIQKLYSQSSIQLLITGGVLYLLLLLNIDTLIMLLPSAFAGVKWVVVWVGLAKIFDMATSINGEIIQTSHKYKFNLYVIALLIILTIAFTYWLIPIYDLVGAALAISIITFIYNLIKWLYVWIVLGLQPFEISNIYIIAILGIAYFISVSMPNYGHWIFYSCYKSILFCILSLVPILWLNFSPSFTNFSKQILEKLNIKLK